ncbi:hypothetical protein M758_UG142000 [Ceratodon purpureus]|nr:hypothetical protein M758_UG142000 [Ceratodon purpureus]
MIQWIRHVDAICVWVLSNWVRILPWIPEAVGGGCQLECNVL